MASLSTHVLDTSTGLPVRNLRLSLWRITENKQVMLREFFTNDDGRVDNSLSKDTGPGVYSIIFDVESYFQTNKVQSQGYFFDKITVRFIISEALSHYHVPLLLSPFGYSTYRGS